MYESLFLTFLSVSGIGHKIKSVNNPDLRVELVKEFVRKNFPSHSLLDYALAVEKVTTSKKDTLILNVDGCIAVCFVDLLRDSGAFSREEADEYAKVRSTTPICCSYHSDLFPFRLVLSTVSSSSDVPSVSSVTISTKRGSVLLCTVTPLTTSSSTWPMSLNLVSWLRLSKGWMSKAKISIVVVPSSVGF